MRTPRYRRLLLQKHAALAIPLLLVLHLNAQDRVRIEGRVHVPRHIQAPVDLTLVEGDSTCSWVPVRGKGRFRIEAGSDECYLLKFDQIGSLSKAVRVDTRYVERRIAKSRRVVKFDVVLRPEVDTADLHYAGPVGRIKFHRSNGRELVGRNYTLARQGLLVMEDMPACDTGEQP